MRDEIIRERLKAQGLTAPQNASIESTVSHSLALQGQDDQAVLWAVGARAPGCTEGDVTQAIAEARLVRTWPMRGTLHLLAAEDARWMLRLLTPRMVAQSRKRRVDLEIDAATLQKAEPILVKALEHGPVTREHLNATLTEAGILTDGGRLYHILWYLSQHEVLCCGPRQGKKQTFALMDSWVPPSPPVEREEALGRLALRYFQGHGPATANDLAWWAGLTLGDARLGINAVKDSLRTREHAGKTYLSALDAESAPHPRGVLLLPGFDEYFLGYQDRSLIVEPAQATLVVPGSNGIFKAIIVREGRVVGVWHRQIKKTVVEVTLTPFPGEKLSRDEVEQPAQAYARFLELELKLQVEDGC